MWWYLSDKHWLQYDITKSIEVDRHIKQKVDSGKICTLYVPTTSQLVNILTKRLSYYVFHTIIVKLEMDNIHSLA